MSEINRTFRNKAKALLAEGRVNAVLGFTSGTTPMARRPFLARTPEEAEFLLWDSFCLMNLANFLPLPLDGPIAVAAKGCDWRNLVVHHQEGRIDIRQLVVLGVSCAGMVDPEKIASAVGGVERVIEAIPEGGRVEIVSTEGSLSLDRETLLRRACRECECPAPLSVQDWIGPPADENAPRDPVNPTPLFGREPLDAGFGTPEGRMGEIRNIFHNCLMCFACRDACPLCHCRKCFADVEKSRWFSPEPGHGGTPDFHLIRAHHITGRCTGCGACESACPMNIPVRRLVQWLNLDWEKTFGQKPGLNFAAPPAGSVFRPADHEITGRRR